MNVSYIAKQLTPPRTKALKLEMWCTFGKIVKNCPVNNFAFLSEGKGMCFNVRPGPV